MPLAVLILLGIYFGIGFIYAVWVLLFGYDKWYLFPINCLFGMPVIIWMTYLTVTGKKNPLKRY